MLKSLRIYYLFISLPFVLLMIGSVIFFDAISLTISKNPHPQINYTIFVIILVGGFLILMNSRRLVREARRAVTFSQAVQQGKDLSTLKETTDCVTGDVACLLQMLATSAGRAISHQEQVAIENELSNARGRLVRRNALPQYLTGLLVGMGLLGTFIGLLATLSDISTLISSFADIDMQTASPLLIFRTMIERMKAPMQSMGIAFSASMFGLLGSIILGLMMVGIRRLQGDIFSVLSSEVARHIELALSYETVSYRSGIEFTGDVGDIARVLIAVEERLSETARLQERTLGALNDDFRKHRGDMLRVLTEQVEASNSFRSELQQLISQLSPIFQNMQQGNGEVSAHLSELTVQIAGQAKESHKLLKGQVEEQKQLRETLEGYNLEERLAETARVQQRSLATLISDFQSQRSEMQRTIGEQTDASIKFRHELHQVGEQLGTLHQSIEKGQGDIATRLSDLTVQLSADAKEVQMLLGGATNTFRNEVQLLGQKTDDGIAAGTKELCARIKELLELSAAEAKRLQQLIEAGRQEARENAETLDGALGKVASQVKEGAAATVSALHTDLQKVEGQLSSLASSVDKGHENLGSKIAAVRERMGEIASASQALIGETGKALQDGLKQLDSRLEKLQGAGEKGDAMLVERLKSLGGELSGKQQETTAQLKTQEGTLQQELQQLAGQLKKISAVVEQGNSALQETIVSCLAPEDKEEPAAEEVPSGTTPQ